jgi:sulfur transfer protein SufE
MRQTMTASSSETLTTLDEILDNFSLLEEWDDRYRYVIELGRGLNPLPERDRTEANKVQGCASQVWLATTVHPNGAGGAVLTFSGDSDAHIVRGLIAIFVRNFLRQAGPRHSFDECYRDFRAAWPARASHPAALERLPLHGRAHSCGCSGGCGGVKAASRPLNSG